MTENSYPTRRKPKHSNLHEESDRTNSSPSSSMRRRQWLINKGILSPSPGPSKRLGSIFPKVGRNHNNSTRSRDGSTSDIQVEIDASAIPIVVTRDENEQNESNHPTATRTVSMPPDDNRSKSNGILSRCSTHTNSRTHTSSNDRPSTPSGKKNLRFLKRFTTRRKRSSRKRNPNEENSIYSTKKQYSDVHVNPIGIRRKTEQNSRPNTNERSSMTSRNSQTHQTNNSRTIYTVVDRRIPRDVLEGDAEFDENLWKEYRDKIDQLAEDSQFMDYLTASVGKRLPLGLQSKERRRKDPEQLAANKLYPLAFIRLLEAHARYSAEKSEPDNPEEEQHRYDDLDGEEHEPVERTFSNGMFDSTRFRTVRVSSKDKLTTSVSSRNTSDVCTEDEESDHRSETTKHSSIKLTKRFTSVSRQNQNNTVPVC